MSLEIPLDATHKDDVCHFLVWAPLAQKVEVHIVTPREQFSPNHNDNQQNLLPLHFHLLLRREGLVVNHKRTERIYQEEGLSLRKRKRKKTAAMARVILPAPTRMNERWSMDFVTDSIVTGRRFRALVIVDDYSRESPAIEVDTSLGGRRVVQVLERLAETRGLPEVITIDNGPEFTGKALDEWAYRKDVKLDFIRPGKPIENAYAESFIGRLRDECLNESWLITLKDARDIIENWRIDYNEGRPHSSLGGLTPREYIENTGKTLTVVGL